MARCNVGDCTRPGKSFCVGFEGGLRHLGGVTAARQGELRSTEKLVLRALIVSLLLHFFIFGAWKLGQAQGWWQALTMPRWLQRLTQIAMPAMPKKIAVTPPPTPLMFVEVDPAAAVTEPLKPQYEGAHSTAAANPEITRPSPAPDFRGRQDKELKTTDPGHHNKVAAAPSPAPKPLPAPEQPRPVQAAPKKSYTPGNLAMAQPSEKRNEKDGTAQSTSDQPQLQPQPQPLPVHHRPRTLEEAREMAGIPGEKLRAPGGVNHIDAQSALAVKGTMTGAYFDAFVTRVKVHWDQLLRDDPINANGKVVLNFKLRSNGEIIGMKMVSNEVTDLLGTLCEQAVLDPAPYDPWPQEMRLENPTDAIELQFTFYYETY